MTNRLGSSIVHATISTLTVLALLTGAAIYGSSIQSAAANRLTAFVVPVAGSDTSVVPVAGSDTSVVPVAGSDTSVVPVAGSDTSVVPVAGSDTSVLPIVS